MITQKKQQPRGIRNNNPLNMVRTKRSKWVGMRPQQTDKMFCQFTSMAFGVRAAFIQLEKYWDEKHLRTISKIVRLWCPDSEKVMMVYENVVSGYTGIPKDDLLPRPSDDYITWSRIFNAMCRVENGCSLASDDITLGYSLFIRSLSPALPRREGDEITYRH